MDTALLAKTCIDALKVHGNTLISVRSFCNRTRTLWNKSHTRWISEKKIERWITNNPEKILDNEEFCNCFKENIENQIGRKINLKFYGQTDLNTVDCFIIKVVD